MNGTRDFIREILERVDIVDVIGRYVSLKKRGRNYVALCPFHPEKKPSFTVSPEKGLFYCFGCNKGGNAITFIKEYRKLDSKSAVVELAEFAGVEVPEWFVSEEYKGRRKEYETIWKINEEALKYYRRVLRTSEGEKAVNYLKSRGVDEETLSVWGIGYASPLSNGLVNYLLSKGFTEREILNSGLAVKREGGIFDLFRNRIIFPVRDERKRVAGFAGRTLGDEEPKYLNVPETPVYRKSYLLYGMDKAWDEIKRSGYAVLVEGYMDVISLHTHGIKTAVATCGTALGESQLRILKKLTEKVILMFDGDEGGRRAMTRAIEHFFKADLIPYGVFLPDDMDPDEFVRKRGAGEVEKMLREAKDIFELYIKEKAEGAYDIRTKRLRIEEIVELLKLVESPVESEHYSKLIADFFSIPRFMVDEIKKKERRKAKTQKLPEAKTNPEFALVKMVIREPEKYLEKVKENIEYLPESSRIFIEEWMKSGMIEDILLKLDEKGIDPSPFVEAIMSEEDIPGYKEERFYGLLKRVMIKRLLEESENLQRKIESFKDNVPGELLEKKKEIAFLIKKIKEEH